MNAYDKVKRVAKFATLYQVAQRGLDEVICLGALRQAHTHAKGLGKPVLNISCGSTAYGHVNADIFPQNVPNFVRYEPDRPLPFPDKMFGAVYSAHTVEHTKNPAEFMAELRRVADKVFCVYPLISSLDAYAPYHRWLGLGLHGDTWLRNPLYWPKVNSFVDRLNFYPTKFLPMALFKFNIEPNYMDAVAFDGTGFVANTKNAHYVALYDLRREHLLFSVGYDLVKKDELRGIGALTLSAVESLRVQDLELNPVFQGETGRMIPLPQFKRYKVAFRDPQGAPLGSAEFFAVWKRYRRVQGVHVEEFGVIPDTVRVNFSNAGQQPRKAIPAEAMDK